MRAAAPAARRRRRAVASARGRGSLLCALALLHALGGAGAGPRARGDDGSPREGAGVGGGDVHASPHAATDLAGSGGCVRGGRDVILPVGATPAGRPACPALNSSAWDSALLFRRLRDGSGTMVRA